MRTVDVRNRMLLIAEALERQETVSHLGRKLRYLERQLKRRPSMKRAANHSAPMTPQIRKGVRLAYQKNPKLANAEIALMFNINPGRVSEILRGKRK